MFARIFLIFVTALAVGCSRDSEPSKQKLRFNLYTEPPTLDPRFFTDATSANVLLMLFEGLTRIDADHTPQPALAKEITLSDDGRVYTFKLRKSTWSNGEPISADDFASSWRQIVDPKFPSPFAYKLYPIKNAAAIKEGTRPVEDLGVRVLDPLTLEVTLNYPTPYFLELIAFPTFYPVYQGDNPDWAAEASADYISNGPFVLKTWEHESEIVVKKNPRYWDSQAVTLDTVHLAMVDDTTTEFYMFEMGELDWAGSPLSCLPPEFIPALIAEEKVTIFPSTGTYYFKLNTDDPVLSNQKIRRALGLALDRQGIVEHITQAGQKPALGLVPSMPGWDDAIFYEDGDVEQARTLLAEGLAELGLEKLPPLTFSFNTNREHQKIAQAVQHQWKEALGIKIDLETVDWKVYLSKINKQNYQIARMGWLGDFHDPVSFLEPFKFNDEGGNNETGWENPAYIALLNAAEQELDREKRNALLHQAEALLLEEMPIIPLFFINFGYLKKPGIEDVYVSPLGLIDLKRARVKA